MQFRRNGNESLDEGIFEKRSDRTQERMRNRKITLEMYYREHRTKQT